MVSHTELVKKQREYYLSGATLDLTGRKKRIDTFKRMLIENKQALDDAIYKDLRRHPSVLSDVDFVSSEVEKVLKNIDEWVKPRKFETPNDDQYNPSSDELYLVSEPLGIVLIISPWNGPLICAGSLIHAFAAGNTVIVKPSELNVQYAPLFAELARKYFDENDLAVFEGGVDETTELLKERFDHIVYTGSPSVAKIIMTAAARHLTPVTLELGGKNPVFVDASADLSLVAQGIVTAKILNAGQACIGTDYILCTPEMKPVVIATLSAAFDALGDMSKVVANARIINDRHFNRIMGLLKDTKGRVVYKAGGAIDENDRFLPFHLVEVESADDVLMQEEIFGPVLPIMTVPSFDAALNHIKRNEKPLAAYIFTASSEQAERFVRETSSGGVTVNGSCAQHGGGNLPFGGVGNSGMGRLSGKYGFDTLSHEKPICVRNNLKVDFNL